MDLPTPASQLFLKRNAPLADALPFKKLPLKYNWQSRVLFFDPGTVYARLSINIYRRNQAHLTFKEVFPDYQNSICSCGCGQALWGRRKRWASAECTAFALAVWAIIDGQVGKFEYFITKYNRKKCAACGSRRHLKVDHVVPVKHGGGGCWLSNYQLLCHNCHVTKTNKDFGWKQPAAQTNNADKYGNRAKIKKNGRLALDFSNC